MQADIQLILSFLGILGIGGVIGAYFSHFFEKKREIELRQRERKEEQYKKFLENLIGFFKGWEDKERQKNFMEELYTHAPLYASSEVIRLANKYLTSFMDRSASQVRKSDSFYRKLVVAIRKDLKVMEKEKEKLVEKDVKILKLD